MKNRENEEWHEKASDLWEIYQMGKVIELSDVKFEPGFK